MYTSYIGKKFLQLYNQNQGTDYTAERFFTEQMFPMFFDHEKHLMHVGNSAFFQKPSQNALTKGKRKSLVQLEKMQKDIREKPPGMSTFVGFASEDMGAVTSGQLSDINFRIDSEEMYASWIGQALAIGVSGGFLMLLECPEVLLVLQQGWTWYRSFIEQTPHLKGRQIETWNGHWLCHAFSRVYNPDFPMDGFAPPVEPPKDGISNIPTQSWTKLLFALCRRYPKQVLTAYLYSLSQMNTTLGFINLYLPQVRRLFDVRDQIFINETQSVLSDQDIENLEPFYRLRNACERGFIGLRALEPDRLRDYMPKQTLDFTKNKPYKFTDADSHLHYQLYKLWIVAMLNKTELLELADQLAAMLLEYEKSKTKEDRGKTMTSNQVKEVCESYNVKIFIERSTALLNAGNADLLRRTVEQVLKMPADNFPLFITLVRFEYERRSIKHTTKNELS